ncbi:MAG: hypothetical protein KKF06_06800 [Candidatus Margulisbacteria bacterium]|nr:hypothetical protein [Candidatus Margulisiibacteriota bacterium]
MGITSRINHALQWVGIRSAPATLQPSVLKVGAALPVSQITLKHMIASYSPAALRAVVDHLKVEGRESDAGVTGYIRQRASDGSPGALCVFLDGFREVIPLGDQHGNKTMLNYLINRFGLELHAGLKRLVSLGDIKDTETGNLRDMKSSYELFKATVMMKFYFPETFHPLLGNHDVVFPGVKDLETAKSIVRFIITQGEKAVIDEADTNGYLRTLERLGLGQEIVLVKENENQTTKVVQGIEYLKYVVFQLKGEGMNEEAIARELMAQQEFFDNSPLTAVVLGKDELTFLSHAGFIRGGISNLGDLIDARLSPDVTHQLLWNRFDNNDRENSENKPDRVRAADVNAMVNGLASIFNIDGYKVNMILGHRPGSAWSMELIPKVKQIKINHANIVRHTKYPSYGFTTINGNGHPSEEYINTTTIAA